MTSETMSDEQAIKTWLTHEDVEICMELCHQYKWRWDSYQVLRPFCMTPYRQA